MTTFLKALKEKWNTYLKRLAESNKELFGNKRPNCCDGNYITRTNNNKQ